MYCGNAACGQYHIEDTYLVKNPRNMPNCTECGEKLEKIISPFFAKTSDKTGSKPKWSPVVFCPIAKIVLPLAKKAKRKYQASLN